jgi:uncharacterized membrane protein
MLILGVISYREPEVIIFLTSESTLPFLTANEASHMQDVRELMEKGIFVSFVCTLLVVLYGVWRGIHKTIARNAFFFALASVLLLLPFNYAFEYFHKLFFPQGNWQFPLDSWLITHFPPVFFVLTALTLTSFTLLVLGLLWYVLPKE